MSLGRVRFVLTLGIFCLSTAFAESNSQVLDKVWAVGRKESCSQEMRARFSDANLVALKSQLADESNRDSLARILNPFLFSLGYSHTQFFSNTMESFYLFRAYFSDLDPKAPPAPMFINPGVRVGSDDHGFYVRDVLHGFPAHAAGVRRGDRILVMDKKPFAGSWGAEPKASALVRTQREGQIREVHLPMLSLNWSQALQDATLHSIQSFQIRGRNIGYVRLWSGVHADSAAALWRAVREFKAAKVDGVILDLRGGYGGAFWPHLDPFFADRSEYFEMTATDGDNQTTTLRAPPKDNHGAYAGPMAVLVDEGSRSGKEALAFQFKKSKRAKVFGSTTAGYFSGGGLFFGDEPVDYLLYLCVRRDSKLDGVAIEGIGIRPDVTVSFDTENAVNDSQLQAALEYLAYWVD